MKFNNKKASIKNMTITSVTAALYIIMTMCLAPISYGVFQFRISEMMNLLAFLNPIYAPGIILGCFISNMYSPFGIMDVIFGTFATAITMFFITKTKNLFIATLWPTIFSFFIGIEIAIINHFPINFTEFNMDLLLGIFTESIFITFSVMVGEFVVMTIIGYPVMKFVTKNKKLKNILSFK